MVSLIAALALVPAVPLGEYRLEMGSEWRRLRLVSSIYFTYEAGGCFHRESNEGHYVVSGDRILFDPPLDVTFDKRLSDELRIVRWGKAALLVAPHEILSLGAMARSTEDSEKVASCFFRVPAAVKELTGSPELPKPFDQLAKKARAYRVLFADGKVATIDGGTRDGLLPGTALACGSGNTLIVGLVRRCWEDRAEVGWLSLGDRTALEAGARFEVAKDDGLMLGRALGPTLLKATSSGSGTASGTP